MQESQLFLQCAPPVGLMIFAIWGLGPLLRIIRRSVFQKDDRHWKEGNTRYILTSYLRPLLLWIAVILICRAFDPVVLSTEASQAIKQRFLNFVRSLSTVLAFAYCTASLSQQMQKLMLDQQGTQDSRNVGADFIGNTVYTAVWIAAVCLFMELLGFSTQKWLTAGGLGTVLLTLAGREIFTNFLSSIMIHATRPFVVNEWIQTKIEGYEVSGTVEHVGWWSPTIVRGDDREAVHIPNHKFTVSVVRNLSQKSHWRIKTHFGISHLDVSKITSIVADMRKVLAKHPQVEQRRLHRRVFFDNIDPDSQALLILVSCFVKTPHFEEYLRVKEIILLDLMKVISHHHGRLATPIRSVQRIYDEVESRGAPFRDMSRSAEAQGRPYLLIEASAIANGNRDTEQSSNANSGAINVKDGAVVANEGSDVGTGTSRNDSTVEVSSDNKGHVKQKEQAAEGRSKSGGASAETVQSKTQLEGLDSMGLNSNDITLLGAAFEKPPANIPVGPIDSGSRVDVTEGEKAAPKSTAEAVSVKAEKVTNKASDQISPLSGTRVEKRSNKGVEQLSQSSGSKMEKHSSKVAGDPDSSVVREEKSVREDFSDTELQVQQKSDVDLRIDTRRTQPHGSASPGPPSTKQETDRTPGGVSAATKPQLEENLVLGVALDGPKRTLPLDNGIAPHNEQKELVGTCNGNSNSTVKERRDASQSTNTAPSDLRER